VAGFEAPNDTFYYDGQIHALPTYAGASNYEITGINSSGTIVGYASLGSGYVPLLWLNGQVYDLQSLAPPFTASYGTVTLSQPFSINDSGNILVSGTTPSPFSAIRPYELMAVPEPASGSIILGFCVVTLCRRRKRLAAVLR